MVAPRRNALFSLYSLLLVATAAFYLSSCPSSAQTAVPNVTQVLTEAGNFSIFLQLAGAANVTQALQNFISAANTTGATAFIPVNSAFTDGVVTAYKNLSAANQSLVLYYHVIPMFYNTTDVLNISDVSTLATLISNSSSAAFRIDAVNRSSSTGVITVYGNLNSANVRTSNITTFPLAVYPIDDVLLPKEIFLA